jgi:hypothetical protein
MYVLLLTRIGIAVALFNHLQATSSSAPACFKVSMSDSGSGSLFNVDYTVEYGTKAAVKQQQADQKQQPTLESLERIESDEWKAEMKKSARSVLVSINNRTGVNLFRNTMSLSAGRWRRPPPERIEIDEVDRRFHKTQQYFSRSIAVDCGIR